ncbi:type II secretion system F family protein [Alicyclobacillus mali (ex Roth et al. 2021)]|nr:type II secretion system F family protein [Alicyclobacillus mali (ex Roth et al. 2021)]
MRRRARIRLRRALMARLARLPHMEREIALWITEFARMLRSGVDVRLAAAALRSNGARMGALLSQAVQEQVERGQPLVDAFSEWIREVDWISLAAAERAGVFGEGMERIASRMMERVRWRQALLKQLAYPTILLCGTYGLFVFMMLAVLPTLRRLTSVVSAAGVHQGINPEIVSGTCLFVVTAALVTIPLAHFVKRRWPSIPIRPPFERLTRRIRTERLADQLASQLEAGIGAWDAVAWMADRKGDLQRHMDHVNHRLRQGTSLVEAFRTVGEVLDPLFLTLVEVGEVTGEVADCLREGQRIMQLDIAYRLESLAQLAEPIAVGVMGIVVGVLVYSIMVPMYQAIARIS